MYIKTDVDGHTDNYDIDINTLHKRLLSFGVDIRTANEEEVIEATKNFSLDDIVYAFIGKYTIFTRISTKSGPLVLKADRDYLMKDCENIVQIIKKINRILETVEQKKPEVVKLIDDFVDLHKMALMRCITLENQKFEKELLNSEITKERLIFHYLEEFEHAIKTISVDFKRTEEIYDALNKRGANFDVS